ncbi:cell separation during budding, partial [Mortierella sp. AD010]
MKNLRTSWLWISCFQLVCKIRLSHGVESGEDQYPILDVNAKSTFGYTLSKLQATKAHRMWVVNDNLSGKDPFCTVLAETRLGAVVHDFGTGIHRVAVMDSEGNMKGILSQSSTLDFLMRH